jgi:hypothetical protein
MRTSHNPLRAAEGRPQTAVLLGEYCSFRNRRFIALYSVGSTFAQNNERVARLCFQANAPAALRYLSMWPAGRTSCAAPLDCGRTRVRLKRCKPGAISFVYFSWQDKKGKE